MNGLNQYSSNSPKNNNRLRLAIICGGRSAEHEISIVSSRSVLSVIDRSKYEVSVIAITRGGYWIYSQDIEKEILNGTPSFEDTHYLVKPDSPPIPSHVIDILSKQDVVFPLLHGPYGEDGTVQGLLELLNIPYIGAGVTESAICMDKALTKTILKANGLPIVPHVIVREADFRDRKASILTNILRSLTLPIFVKPANLGSSIGITKVKDWDDLPNALRKAFEYDTKVLVELGINAREIEVSVLGNQFPIASVPGEIIPSREFYDYEAKYIDDSSKLLIPAPLSDQKKKEFQDIAIKAYSAIGVSGMARIDFLMDKDTEIVYVNEVNTIPGFTPISMYPKLWEASGIPYSVLIDRLVNLALERFKVRSSKSVYWKQPE